jgi:phospholipid/cholesterol/gamma-HCH transport system permease protein
MEGNKTRSHHISKEDSVSQKISRFFSGLYDVQQFIFLFCKEAFTPPFEFREIIRQCYYIGYRSLAIITLTDFITGKYKRRHSDGRKDIQW